MCVALCHCAWHVGRRVGGAVLLVVWVALCRWDWWGVAVLVLVVGVLVRVVAVLVQVAAGVVRIVAVLVPEVAVVWVRVVVSEKGSSLTAGLVQNRHFWALVRVRALGGAKGFFFKGRASAESAFSSFGTGHCMSCHVT